MHVDAGLSSGTVERDVRRRVVAYEDSLLQIQGPNTIHAVLYLVMAPIRGPSKLSAEVELDDSLT